ncbi:MAG: hypothetical protein LUE64_03245 [Candidatus Gastranaerophilales bacterium]|nr:hypothetical protein [Candidatus Gastranaerophilales bacterium]
MSEDLTETVLQLLGKESDEILVLKIEAKLNEILSYLNRSELTDEIFSSVAVVIADCIKNGDMGNIQSVKEGDLSMSFANNSSFFGKLDSFKNITGVN